MSDTFRIVDGVGWIGDRSFPEATVKSSDRPDYSCRNIQLDGTGWTLSVLWSTGSYSINHDAGWDGTFLSEAEQAATDAYRERIEDKLKEAKGGESGVSAPV